MKKTNLSPQNNNALKKKRESTISLSLKLMFSAMALTAFTVSIVGFTVYLFMASELQENSIAEIKTAVKSTSQMIDQSVIHTIHSQLQATADRNRDIVAYFYKRFKKGELTESEAKEQVKQILLSQKIGDTGYLYVLDSTGTLRVHPKKELVDVDISKYGFIQEQIKRKRGYIEYDWKNPGEEKERPKSLAMSYFKPWDYIISASAYRNEFLSLINIRDFRKEILGQKFGKTGYAYIIDTKGNLLIHPKLEGDNLYDVQDTEGRYFVREMCRKKTGTISYPWKNPGEKIARVKDVVFQYYPPLDIIVAGGIYREELYAPLEALKKRLLLIALIILLITMPAAFFAALTVARPVLKLSSLSQTIAAKDISSISGFDKMEQEELRGITRFNRGAKEIIVLLCSFRDVGLSIKSLLEKLNSNAARLSAQAKIIEDAANFSNNSAMDQLTMVEEVSRTIESLQKTFKRTEKIADDVVSVSQEAVRKSAEGNVAVKNARNSMNTIMETGHAARQQMSSLDALSNQIELVVKSLEEIANTSQILAINASIEASQSGEAGKGFAVVAKEIGDLAVQSAGSTQNIRSFLQQIADTARKAIEMTEDSQLAVSEGQRSIAGMEQILNSLTRVLDSNNQHADQIAQTVPEQSSAITQISNAVDHVLQSSHEITSNVSTLMNTAEELNLTQKDLEILVSEYKV
ncbi:MAG: cache domain-containing protein [Deltaproteobacteria bacterium]|nr:cache domain-containing protein [Deltaproteobacteria bacterium]